MTERALERALQDSVDEVLEKMFFIRSLGDPPGGPQEPELAARLTFNGDPSGSLTLRVTAPAARSVAADFLGLEEQDLSEQEIAEVVCELANMICGSVLSRVESTATFRLSSPQMIAPLGANGDAPYAPAKEGSTVRHCVGICSGAMVIDINTPTEKCLSAQERAY